MRHWVVRCIMDSDWRCRVGSTLGLALLIAGVVYGRISMANAPTNVRLVVYAFSTQEEVLIQSILPACIVDGNVTQSEQPLPQAFVDYLSEASQQALSRHHLRPADLEEERFPGVPQSFSIDDLGGWSQACAQVVEATWQKEIESHLDVEPAPMMIESRG